MPASIRWNSCERCRKQMSEWRRKNAARVAAYDKQYRIENRERCNSIRRLSQKRVEKRSPGITRRRHKEWRDKNIVHVRSYTRESQRKLRAKEPEKFIWIAMLDRCKNTNNTGFKNYGGRGIAVCKRWEKFENFLADMGRRPSKDHSIDRKDNNGNYEPGNCRWATMIEQARNRRDNHLLTYEGVTLTIKEWANRLNILDSVIHKRLKLGWSVEKAVTTPKEIKPLIAFQGRKQTLKAWSRELNISYYCVSDRIHKLGWTVERALSTPPKAVTRKSEIRAYL